jgi:hypothetical protein
MHEADLGHVARREGRAETARKHFDNAYRLERTAAESLLTRTDAEPTRSVLLRSAATLAIRAERFIEAEQIVCIGLAAQPPNEIAEELRDLFEQINFRRHLSLRGVKLGERELQMSIAGPGVGFGIAPTDAVVERIEHTQALMYRMTELKLQRPYRDKGAPSKEVREAVSLFMSVPRAASYAVSLMVGGAQETLQGMSVAEDVIDDVVECLDLFAGEKDEELRKKIPNEDYLTNFKGLARAIAPDGEQIQTVGFTSVREGHERTVALRPPRRAAPGTQSNIVDGNKAAQSPDVTVNGTLLYADAMEDRKKVIKLVDASGIRHSIVVPAGMMDDIVRPLWDSIVTVTGKRKGQQIVLTDITKARD